MAPADPNKWITTTTNTGGATLDHNQLKLAAAYGTSQAWVRTAPTVDRDARFDYTVADTTTANRSVFGVWSRTTGTGARYILEIPTNSVTATVRKYANSEYSTLKRLGFGAL